MMAFDSRSTPPESRTLSETTRTALGEAVVAVWMDPARLRPADDTTAAAALHVALAPALATMVQEARDRALRAEEVIVAFKDLLSTLPELNNPDRRLEAIHFREQLITECIRAYYAR